MQIKTLLGLFGARKKNLQVSDCSYIHSRDRAYTNNSGTSL